MMSGLSTRTSQISTFVGIALTAVAGVVSAEEPIVLLNVSYDPTRELYQDFNAAFARHWTEKTGKTVEIRQSHGGSGKQARPTSSR